MKSVKFTHDTIIVTPKVSGSETIHINANFQPNTRVVIIPDTKMLPKNINVATFSPIPSSNFDKLLKINNLPCN
jgi:hypothetical protein